MASIIRIKRSSGTGKPASLNWGELGYVTGIGSYGGLNQYKDRVFLGDDGSNVNPIGGYYYASMMEHSPGAIAGVTNTRNSDGGIVVILDSSRKVDQWNVDNLRLDGNTFSSQNTDGDIVLDPNGTGEINIVDDTYLSFGNDKDVKLRYDEATDNRFEIEGADWNFANNVAISISDTTASTTPTTGALTVTGGVGFATHLNVGGSVDIDLDLNVDGGDITTNLTAFNLLNATAANINAFGAATALVIGATSGIATIRNATLSVPNATTLNLGATSSATSVTFPSTPNTSFVSIAATTNATSTTSGALRVAGGVGIVSDVYIGGILNVTGTSPGTLTGTASQPLQVNGGAYVSGNLGIGTTNPTSKLFVVGDGYFAGIVTSYGFYVDGNLVGGSISGTNLVGTALSVSGISTFTNGPVLIGGGTSTGTAGQVLQVTGINSSVYIGGNLGVGVTNPTSKLSVDGGINVTGDLNVDGGDVTSNTAALNLFNANVTTANVLGAATALVIGATSGIATIKNPTVVGTQATQNLYNTVATTVNAFGDASTIGIGSTSATLTLRPSTVVGVNATQNLYNTTATTVNAFGAGTAVNLGANSGTLTVGNPTVVGTQATQNLYNTVATNLNFAGAATALVIGATSGVTTIRNATVDLDGDLNVDGGDITTNLTAFNLLNATATNINAFGAATALVIGATSGIATINNPTVVGTQATQNLYNTVATNLNFAGAATALVIGATSGIATINNPTVVGTQATQNLYNTVATNLNFAGAATALDIGATTGIATIRNATLSVPNATTLNLGATSSATSVTFPSTPNTSFVAIAATTNATTTTSGALRVAGGVGIASDVYIGGSLNITGSQTSTNLTLTGNLQVDGNTTLGNASGDVVTITGSVNHTGPLTNVGGVTIDNIGIKSNVISTRSGGGNVLYIDPYPDGLSNEGLVVVKGNLQVDGTTTTVDSSSVTVNGSIISLGDVTSNRTVVVAVLSGVSTITLDSVVGINTGDIISGNAALPNSGLTTITAYDTATKIVTITGTTSSGIASTTQLIVTHAYDTNTDRGIAFSYNTGVGTANQKTGFFGYDDSTGYFTYVPDAGISNSVISGTKGTLDIGALYLNFTTSGISTRGSAYFDTNGKLISTNTPEVGTASTSNLILTTNASNVPVWTDTLDGGTF